MKQFSILWSFDDLFFWSPSYIWLIGYYFGSMFSLIYFSTLLAILQKLPPLLCFFNRVTYDLTNYRFQMCVHTCVWNKKIPFTFMRMLLKLYSNKHFDENFCFYYIFRTFKYCDSVSQIKNQSIWSEITNVLIRTKRQYILNLCSSSKIEEVWWSSVYYVGLCFLLQFLLLWQWHFISSTGHC